MSRGLDFSTTFYFSFQMSTLRDNKKTYAIKFTFLFEGRIRLTLGTFLFIRRIFPIMPDPRSLIAEAEKLKPQLGFFCFFQVLPLP